jgi:chromosome partitioning protein
MPPAVLSVASGKGGVGKTTTVANLSVALAQQGLNVLAWDLDGQGNLGQALGADMDNLGLSSYHLMSGKLDSAGAAIRPTQFPGVSLVPAHMELFAAEQELSGGVDMALIMRTLVQQPEAQAFDAILIDLPPNLGFPTVNGLAASRWVLVPLQVSGFALTSLRQLAHAVRLAQDDLNPELELLGLIPTFVSPGTKLSRDVVNALHLIPGARIFEPHVPYTVRVAEGSLSGVPVVAAAPDNPAARAYTAIARSIWEVIRSSPAHVARAPALTIAVPSAADEVGQQIVMGELVSKLRVELDDSQQPKRRGPFGRRRRSPRPAS